MVIGLVQTHSCSGRTDRHPSPHQAAPSIPDSCPPTVGPSLSVQTHVEFARVTTETGRSGDNVMKTGLNCSLSFDSKLSGSARSLGYGGCPISSESRSVGAYQFWAATLCDERSNFLAAYLVDGGLMLSTGDIYEAAEVNGKSGNLPH